MARVCSRFSSTVSTTPGGGLSDFPVARIDEDCTWQFCRYTDTSTDDDRIVARFWFVTETPPGGGDPVPVLFSKEDAIDYAFRTGTQQTVELFVRDGDGQLDSAFVVHGPDVDPLVFRDADDDADGTVNIEDNCLEIANGPAVPDGGGNVQRDTDGDGFGNVCDADFTGDDVVNFADVAYFRGCFGGADPACDFNGDGLVNFFDLGQVRKFFGKRPGPGNPQKRPPSAFIIFAEEPPSQQNPCTNSSRCAWEDLSSDIDGTVVSRAWTVSARPPTPAFVLNSAEKIVDVDFPNVGTYEVQLLVTDDDGLVDVATLDFTVEKINQPPKADFDLACELSLETGLTCTVTSQATDADGQVIARAWRIGREGVEEPDDFVGLPAVTFDPQGTEFVIQHIVSDDDGADDLQTREFDLQSN